MTSEPGRSEDAARLRKSVTKAAGSVGLATMFSRVTGFLRDMLIAHLFGAKEVADAFFMAFRIPNLLRRFTAEGALTAAMVPVFTQKLAHSRQEAFDLARNLLTIMAAAISALVVLGMIFMSLIIMVIAPGFYSEPEKFALTVDLSRLMFPYLLLISMAAALMAMANSMGKFFIPALAPVLLNISIILCAFLTHNMFAAPVTSLAVGVLVGGVLQLAMQYHQAMKLGFSYRPKFDLRDKDTRKIGSLMVPAALGVAAVEINLIVDSMLASLLPPGSVSYLYYGIRVVQLPMGVFGAAMSLATLPAMSGQVTADGSKGRLVDIFSHAARISFLVSIPAAAGLILLSAPITNLLFERGQFDQAARDGAAYAMSMFAIGLPGLNGIRIVANVFYSLKDTATPAKVAGWCVLANIALSLALIGPMAHGGLALATSLASFINIAVLVWLLRKRVGLLDGRRITLATFKIILASSLMGAAAWVYCHFFYNYSAPFLHRAFHLSAAITMAMVVYFAALRLMRSEEVAELWQMAQARLARRKTQ